VASSGDKRMHGRLDQLQHFLVWHGRAFWVAQSRLLQGGRARRVAAREQGRAKSKPAASPTKHGNAVRTSDAKMGSSCICRASMLTAWSCSCSPQARARLAPAPRPRTRAHRQRLLQATGPPGPLVCGAGHLTFCMPCRSANSSSWSRYSSSAVKKTMSGLLWRSGGKERVRVDVCGGEPGSRQGSRSQALIEAAALLCSCGTASPAGCDRGLSHLSMRFAHATPCTHTYARARKHAPPPPPPAGPSRAANVAHKPAQNCDSLHDGSWPEPPTGFRTSW